MAMRPNFDQGPREPRSDLGPSDFGERWSRAWTLLGDAWPVLRSTRSIWVLAIATMLVGAVACAVLLALADRLHLGSSYLDLAIAGLIVDLPVRLVATFLGVATCRCAARAIDGERATVRDGLIRAWQVKGPIVAWSVLATVIGRAISVVTERIPFLGGVLGFVMNVAWEAVSFLAIAVIATHGTGPRETVRRTTAVVRERWGEGAWGVIGISAITVVITFPATLMLFIGLALVRTDHDATGIALIAAGASCLILVYALSTAVQEVFALAVLRYAETGVADGPFPANDIEGAVRLGRQRWWH